MEREGGRPQAQEKHVMRHAYHPELLGAPTCYRTLQVEDENLVVV